jgi:hypothetical protein
MNHNDTMEKFQNVSVQCSWYYNAFSF